MKFPSAFALYVSTIHGLISGMSRPFLLFPDPAPLSWWQDQTCKKNCVKGSGLSASLRLAPSMRTNVEIDEMLTKLRAHLSPSRPIFGRLHPDCSRQKAACHDAVKARCSWKQSCYSRGTIKNLFKVLEWAIVPILGAQAWEQVIAGHDTSWYVMIRHVTSHPYKTGK